jgi:hypothetical protein
MSVPVGSQTMADSSNVWGLFCFQILSLEEYMLYAHGSDLCHDLELRHAMANCFEALMGALFLDGGIEVWHICSYQSGQEINCIGCEDLMAVSIKNVVPYSLVDKYTRFGGTFCLCLQGRNSLHVFYPEDGGSRFLCNSDHLPHYYLRIYLHENLRNKKGALMRGKRLASAICLSYTRCKLLDEMSKSKDITLSM